ncbi:MAG: 50S ribosomal protein L9 [Gammaproteobacteria bacterium]
MEIILLEKVENLGGIGDKVKVRAGYGRNYLIPQGKATLATEAHLAAFEARRAELEAKAAGELGVAQARAEKVGELQLVITAKAGEEGKLFGSVGTIDIAEAATAAGVALERSEVRLHDGPLRLLGEHPVEIHLHADVSVELMVTVAAEDAPSDQD